MQNGKPQRASVLLERRNLLKLGLVGGGAFVLGKFVGPLLPFFSADRIIAEKELQDFKLIETEKKKTEYIKKKKKKKKDQKKKKRGGEFFKKKKKKKKKKFFPLFWVKPLFFFLASQ